MKPLLDEYVWEVITDSEDYFLVKSVFLVNSLSCDITNLEERVIIIPEKTINDLHKLDLVDYNIVNNNKIPILRCVDETWLIDLKHYDYFLQSFSS